MNRTTHQRLRLFRAVFTAIATAAATAAVIATLIVAAPLSVRAELSPVEQRIAQHVDDHNDEAIEFLERIVNMNSGTMNLEGVRDVGRAFAPEFERLGFRTEWIDGSEFQRAGHLVATHKGQGPHILLIGHLDTVFEPDGPFQTYELLSGNRARGPGIADMKGGDVIIVQALAALHAADVLDPLTITVILIGDEEKAGRPVSVARTALIDAAQKADIAIAFENGDNDPATAVISRRGSSKWRITVTGTPAHSSQIFRDDIGAGAVYEASRILHRFYTELAGEPYLTFNPGLILGGTYVDHDTAGTRGTAFGKNNVIAEHTVASGDLRTLYPEQLADAKERMRAIVADHLPGTSATITFHDSYPPLAPSDGNYRLLKILSRVSVDLGMGEMGAVDPSRAGAADIAFTAGYVEMALDGLGLIGGDEHTENEWADLTTLPTQTKRTALLLYRLSSWNAD
ncbi:MAG: M20/M25/M40 family metallo-hydrolase [Candidatus Krumholzibacteriota bacterium]|nr:M20/M25/M40 family metallo-hydrolase [Candidatus Krumholzibacteriota bacterium]